MRVIGHISVCVALLHAYLQAPSQHFHDRDSDHAPSGIFHDHFEAPEADHGVSLQGPSSKSLARPLNWFDIIKNDPGVEQAVLPRVPVIGSTLLVVGPMQAPVPQGHDPPNRFTRPARAPPA